jgi:hypothetical protein
MAVWLSLAGRRIERLTSPPLHTRQPFEQTILTEANRDSVLLVTGQTSPGEPEVTVEAPEAILCRGGGLDIHDLPCESDREPHAPIDPESDRQP